MRKPKMYLPAGVSDEPEFACLQCGAMFTATQQAKYENHVVFNCPRAQADYDESVEARSKTSPLFRSATREELDGKVDLELEDWVAKHATELDENRKRL